MVETPSISHAVIGTEQYVQLPLPDMSIDNARQRLVSFLNARTTAPIILFQNHAADIDARQKAYEAQPFDFERGEFKPDAVETFKNGIETVIEREFDKGSVALSNLFWDAEDRLDDEKGRLRWEQEQDIDRIRSRYLRSYREFFPLRRLPQTNDPVAAQPIRRL